MNISGNRVCLADNRNAPQCDISWLPHTFCGEELQVVVLCDFSEMHAEVMTGVFCQLLGSKFGYFKSFLLIF